MMTREQMELLCANTLQICMGKWTSEMDILLTHDQAQRADIARLREALQALLDENIDYIRINNLSAMGNVNVIRAQQALKDSSTS